MTTIFLPSASSLPLSKSGHRVAEALPVGRGQVVHRHDDVVEPDARRLHVARVVDAGGDQHRVVPFAQFLEGGVGADVEVEMEGDAAVDQMLRPAANDLLLELEVGDAIDEQAADPVVAVVDMDLPAPPAQFFRRRHAAGAGADDADALLVFDPRLDRLDPASLPGRVGNVFLDRADGDSAVAGLFDDAVAFAQAVLRADAAADLRHVVGRRGDLVGLLQAPFGGQQQPVGNVVAERAMHLAVGHTALRAAARLFGRALGGIFVVDLVEVVAARGGVAFVRHALADGDEFEHLIGHLARTPLVASPHVFRPIRDAAVAAFAAAGGPIRPSSAACAKPPKGAIAGAFP